MIFPPKPRDYGYSLPIKVRKLALRAALSEFNREAKLKLVDAFSLPAPKTKDGVKYFKSQGLSGRVLVVMAEPAAEFEKGVRNIDGTKLVQSKDLNIFDLMKSDWVLIEKKAVDQLEQRIA